MTSKTDIPSSSFSPPPFRKLTYDVFLSFRGTDTRKNFTDHLYAALKQKGIFTFRDDEELERGESIGLKLLKAIEESRYVIAVFSRNYADSSWCLDEIAKVAECMKAMGQKVLPVFYDVDPSEVRRQKAEKSDHFEKAFAKHQKRFEGNPEKVQRWKDALFEIGNLSGWHLQDGSEAKVIQEIVEKIFTELNQIISSISEGLVGMDSHLNEMLSYLDTGCPDVRIIGIWGMGGIGKTTIAEVVFERVKAQFEGDSFLQNVREEIKKKGAVHLQEQLLLNLLKTNLNIQNTKMGEAIIRRRLGTKRVLIVLDDVDQEEQLEALCDRSWFGPGTRVIVTSRDEHLLSVFGADKVYKVNPLTDAEALHLFHMKAFKKDQLVGEDFLELSKEFLKYANGLPLAIKVLGSSVNSRSVKLWSTALDRLKKNPQMKIIDVLKVSFDGLEETEKKTFLDIACFFKGENIDRVTKILQGCDDHCPDFDIQVLMDKSLVTLFGKRLWMHDLMQELSWEVVRQECRDEPGKRSRLWLPNEIINVLDRSKATSAVQSISLEGPTKDDVVHSINDSFSKMDRLRLLKISNVKFSGNIKYLSNELQFLQWHDCPLDSFPSDFQPDNLVELRLSRSRIEQLWKGNKGWSKLRLIDLSGSQYLRSTPNFSDVPDLEMLSLQDCTSLVEVHPSLGFLKKLIVLNMSNCKSVESIPPFTSLGSLKLLSLSFCSRLKKFPEIGGNMSLLKLYLKQTSIEELPPSVKHLTGLTLLDLGDCKNLLHLPSTIRCMTSLKCLNLTGCSKLEEIPETLNCVECLEMLCIGGTDIRDLSFLVGMKNLQYLFCQGCKGLSSESCEGHGTKSLLLPASLLRLTRLTELDLSDCNLMDGAIPNDLSSLISLRKLNLSGNSFVRLPESISQLSKLETLNLRNCRQLQLVPKLPSSVEYVDTEDCTSLMDSPNQLKVLTSIESGLTVVNSLDSQAFGDLSNCVKVFRYLPNIQAFGGIHLNMIPDEPTDWKKVDYLLLPLPVLLKDLELSNSLSVSRTMIHVGNEIPEWFGTMSTRNPISIPLPPNEWKGVAACAVFSVKGHTTDVSFIESGSETSGYFYQCTLQTDVVRMKPLVLHTVISSPQLLSIFYLPRGQFSEWQLNNSTVVAARFETNNPFMEVQKCGIRQVYEQDAGWHIKLCPVESGTCLNEAGDALRESGWLSRVDKRLKWEKFIPPLEEDSTLVLRKNIESVLPRYLEALNNYSATYKFNLSGSPAWFEYLFTFTDTKPGHWSYVSILIPQNLHKSKKWMGFAIYASIAEEERHIIKEDKYRVYFKLETGGKSHKTVSRELKHVRSSHHQLLVVYITRAQIPEALFTETSSTTAMHISFRIDSPHVKVQTSGLHIVYQKDIQGFAETIIRCMQKEDSLEFHDKLVVQNWIELIRAQSGHLEGMSNPKERDSRIRREKKFELLSQKYRNWDWSAPSPLYCMFYRAEFSKSKWFMHFNEGNSTEIQLPPNLFDNANWLGIAVCAFCWLSVELPNNVLDSTPDSEHIVLSCCVDSDVASDALLSAKFNQLFKKLKPWEFAADFTWFVYVPRGGKYLKFLRQRNLARVALSSSSPYLGVHSCALRLVFKEDVEHLVQALTLCELP